MFEAIFLEAASSCSYGRTCSLNFDNIYFARSPQFSFMLAIAVAFVITCVDFKLSLISFYLWTAKIYQRAPTSVTSYISAITFGNIIAIHQGNMKHFLALCHISDTLCSHHCFQYNGGRGATMVYYILISKVRQPIGQQ